MASAYLQDLRDRVIDAVVRGEMSRRAAAARCGVSESSAIKWVQRFERSGSRAASKMGGYLRPRLEPHRECLEALRAEKSDITLQALCDRLLAERGVRADTAMMSRFSRRIGVTLKKRRRPVSVRNRSACVLEICAAAGRSDSGAMILDVARRLSTPGRIRFCSPMPRRPSFPASLSWVGPCP